MSSMFQRIRTGIACGAITLVLGSAFAASAMPVDVLLSFDTEAEADVAALERLRIDVPATHFITGSFASAHPDIVRELAAGNTIGSHTDTHPDLTELSGDALVDELRRGRDALTAVTGRAPLWFRAPFLAYDAEVEATLARLGFRYDSSDSERWPVQATLLSLPISSSLSQDVLASDFDLIHKQKLGTDGIGEWLEQRYIEREATGRPLVVLLHPQMIAPHAAALHGFIDFVKERGGRFRTFDDALATTMASPAPRRLASVLEVPGQDVDVAALATKLRDAGVTDAYLPVSGDVAGTSARGATRRHRCSDWGARVLRTPTARPVPRGRQRCRPTGRCAAPAPHESNRSEQLWRSARPEARARRPAFRVRR